MEAVDTTDNLVNLYLTLYIPTIGKIDDNACSNCLGDFPSLYEKICVGYHRHIVCVCVCVCVCACARARPRACIYDTDT